MTRSEGSLSLGLLILRVGFGAYLMTHGWGKVQMLFAGEAENFADPIGLGKTFSLILAAGAEFGCALLVLLGLFTSYAAIPVVITMGVAAFVHHANDPWTMGSTPASRQPAMMFLTAFLALVFTGGGKYSLDAYLANRRKHGSIG